MEMLLPAPQDGDTGFVLTLHNRFSGLARVLQLLLRYWTPSQSLATIPAPQLCLLDPRPPLTPLSLAAKSSWRPSPSPSRTFWTSSAVP